VPRPGQGISLPLAQFRDLAAHRLHLFFERIDFVGPRLVVGACFGSGAGNAAEGREHLHGAFKDCQILAGQIFYHLVAAAQGLGDAVTHRALVLGEAFHAHVQIAGHKGLQTVAVETYQLAQEFDRQ